MSTAMYSLLVLPLGRYSTTAPPNIAQQSAPYSVLRPYGGVRRAISCFAVLLLTGFLSCVAFLLACFVISSSVQSTMYRYLYTSIIISTIPHDDQPHHSHNHGSGWNHAHLSGFHPIKRNSLNIVCYSLRITPEWQKPQVWSRGPTCPYPVKTGAPEPRQNITWHIGVFRPRNIRLVRYLWPDTHLPTNYISERRWLGAYASIEDNN